VASKTTNTLQELLQRFLADMGQFKMVASESDLASTVELETMILQLARKPIENIQQQGLTNATPQDAGMGGMPPSPGAMGNFGSAPPGGPGRQAMPSPDELRRVLGGAQ
jgi:hypothetical protein